MKKKKRHQIRINKARITADGVIKGYINPEDLKHMKGPGDAKGNDATWLLEQRLGLNVRNTGHPFHHKTADGTIVEPDPTVEYLLSKMPVDDRELVIERWKKQIRPDAQAAVPVNLRHYGFYSGFDSQSK